MSGIFTDEQKMELDKMMDYLKALSDDALFWLMLCIGAESQRRAEVHEGCYVETREGYPQ